MIVTRCFLFNFAFLLSSIASASEINLKSPAIVSDDAKIEALTSSGEHNEFVAIVEIDSQQETDGRDSYTDKSPVAVSAAAIADAGSEIEITWSGPDNQQDFLTIVAKGTGEGIYGNYQYTRHGNPLSIAVPDQPGSYEIRYLAGTTYRTLARFPFEVTPSTATLDAADSVSAGANFELTWTGPDNSQDFITIVKQGTGEGIFGTYWYTKLGPKLQLQAPNEPGDYEIRYATGTSYITLARHPIKVVSTGASIKAAETVLAGSKISIEWYGPNDPGDYLAITTDYANAADALFYQYTSKGNPLMLEVPEIPGNYQLRYVTGQQSKILTRRTIAVASAFADLQTPYTIAAGQDIQVRWRGPGNDQDYIVILPKGQQSSETGPYAMVRRGSELLITAPAEPGDYMVHYVTGRKQWALASNPLQVTPSMVPGRISVRKENQVGNEAIEYDAVQIILDASGSMVKKTEGRQRAEIARETLALFTEQVLEEGTPFAMRVFGHSQASSCQTDSEIPLSPLNKKQVANTIAGITAINLAEAPIAESLRMVASDLVNVTGPRMVILVTAGEETCGGDPAEVIRTLSQQSSDLRINIIGFGIEERMVKSKFEEWARLGSGRYFDADNAEQLKEGLRLSMHSTFNIFNTDDDWVGSGVIGGPAVDLLPGEYLIKVGQTNKSVAIESAKEFVLVL